MTVADGAGMRFWKMNMVKNAVMLLALAVAVSVPAIALDTRDEVSPPPAATPDIALPLPRLSGQISVEAAVAARKKVQEFEAKLLGPAQIAQLAFAGCGGRTTEIETAPIRLYFVLESGVYLYKTRENSLAKVSRGDKRSFLAGVVSEMRAVAAAPCTIVITGRKSQSTSAREMAAVKAGMAVEAIQLQAVAMGMGAAVCETIGASETAEALGLPANEMPLAVLAVGYPASGPLAEPPPPKGSANTNTERCVLVVVPQKGILDSEYDSVTSALRAAGTRVVVASSQQGTYRTLGGKQVEAAASLADVDVASYAAVVFLGGPEARQYYQDATAWTVAVAAVRAKKVVAAISTAPRILANAGILAGLRTASNTTERQTIMRQGGIPTGSDTERAERDGAIIITAGGAKGVAAKFAQLIVDALTSPKSAAEAGKPSGESGTAAAPRPAAPASQAK
jgi:putative intracellular protease/amidase/nitroreductase